MLAFRELPVGTRLELRDRRGKRLGDLGRPGDSYPIALSSDDRRLVFLRLGDVWTLDLATGNETRLTFGQAGNGTPVWSPDMQWIAFRRGGKLMRVSSDGKGGEEELGGAPGALTQWLPGGPALISDAGGGAGISLLHLGNGVRPERLPVPGNATEGQVSPDGRWFAYSYSQRGDDQIYVQALSAGGGRWQVSRTGGRQPRWRRDGRELFFVSADGSITAAQIRPGNDFAVTSTEALFDIGATTGLPANIGFYYDVTADGQRFVFSTVFSEQIRTPISVVLNWEALLTSSAGHKPS